MKYGKKWCGLSLSWLVAETRTEHKETPCQESWSRLDPYFVALISTLSRMTQRVQHRLMHRKKQTHSGLGIHVFFSDIEL